MNDTIAKVVRDGRVAVLVSPNYGAGWSTWASENSDAMMFNPTMVEAVLAGKTGKDLEALSEQLYPEAYSGGAGDLEVAWVPVGARFYIHEYDGSETLRVCEDMHWVTA